MNRGLRRYAGIIVVVCAVLLFALSVWLGIKAGPLSRDIALFFLSCPAIFLSLLPLALVGAMAFGLHKLRGVVPPAFAKLRELASQVNTTADKLTTQAATPLIATHALGARLQGWARYIRKEVNS